LPPEPVQGFADAINRADLDAALEVCHPQIEFLSILAVGGGRYFGHAGIRRYFEDVASAWAEWRVEVHGIEPLPDGRFEIDMTMKVRGRGSGATLSERTAHIWTVRDRRLLRNEPVRRPDLGPE
jgi:ketosteroid isomerase-like protein